MRTPLLSSPTALLPPPQEEARVEAPGSGSQSMDRLVDLLNSMRSNSSGVEQQLASFMEEAQCSARSEEALAQVVSTIYAKAVSDRSFASTAAKLCDKMALFMVEGTKFRSLLLNSLQVRAPPPSPPPLPTSNTLPIDLISRSDRGGLCGLQLLVWENLLLSSQHLNCVNLLLFSFFI